MQYRGMETILSYLPKLDSLLEKKYPGITWVRVRVLEYLDKNNQNVYYEISYRLFNPYGRWNATVIWQNGEKPKLHNVWR